MSEPVAPALSPAGIVKTEADTILDKVHEALDGQGFRNEFLEGVPLEQQELASRSRLLHRIAQLANEGLAGRVKILGAWPEVTGRGARFRGTDSEGRDYQIDLHLEDETRMAHGRIDLERDVRESVGLIVAEVLRQRTRYMTRMGGSA